MKWSVAAILSLFILTSMVPIQPTSSQVRKLDFVFLLHANQALVPYGDVANDLNYESVLRVLRNHPALNITLHVSGTLISTLSYLNRETLNLIRDGVRDGQFELAGSTYSQNIIYSQYSSPDTDKSDGDFDNNIGIELHRKILEEQFGVTPTTFWNPERVWDPDILPPLLTSNGYRATFVEDHILSSATSTAEHLVRETGDPQNPLYVFSDDRDLIFNDTSGEVGLVDVIQEGPKGEDYDSFMNRSLDNLINYLRSVYDSDTGDEKVVVYAQDMEAWGLWQVERGTDTTAGVARRLDDLLTRLEAESGWLQLSHPSDVIDSLLSRSYNFEHVDIPFGEAAWMTRIALDRGYSSWKQWQDSNPSLAQYRRDFDVARGYMQEAAKLVDPSRPLTEKIYETMKYIYSANQYEFGCITCNFFWWGRTKTVGIGLEAIRWVVSPSNQTSVYSTELDGDGFLEDVIKTPTSMYVFSSAGGRLIAWFDAELEEILLYDDAPASYMESAEANFHHYPGETSGFWGRSSKEFYIRQGSFVDFPRYNFTTGFAKGTYSKSKVEGGFIYTNEDSSALVRKQYVVLDSGLQAVYSVTNKRNDNMPVYVSFSANIGGYSEYLYGRTNSISISDNVVSIDNSHVKMGISSSSPFLFVSENSRSLFESSFQLELGETHGSKDFTLLMSALPIDEEFVIDAEAPTVTILSPKEGDTISGIIQVDVNSSDNVGISRYLLFVNGSLVYERTTLGPLLFYDKEMFSGPYVLTVKVMDEAGNSANDSVLIFYIGKEPTSTSSDVPSTTSAIPLFFPATAIIAVMVLFRRGR